jgi:ethanolamine utilization cobalamin adenosyltransferase
MIYLPIRTLWLKRVLILHVFVYNVLMTLRLEALKMEKQEHRTLLGKSALVDKTDPRIELRGRLDSLSAAIVDLQIVGLREGSDSLVQDLEEVLTKVYEILSREVTGEICPALSLWGLDADEIRERSHHPARYFGIGHIRPHHSMGAVAAGLNTLRTKVREAELSACRALTNPESAERLDIIEALNRLSSAIYILIYKYLPEGYSHMVRFSG